MLHNVMYNLEVLQYQNELNNNIKYIKKDKNLTPLNHFKCKYIVTNTAINL